jgi:hypothetical protein
LEQQFLDRRLIWNNIELFQKKQVEWKEKDFSHLKIEEVEVQMRFFESSNSIIKQRINLLTEKGYDKQLEFFIVELKEFQYMLPIILALGNKDLKEQHWSQMSSQVHPSINSTKKFSINDLIGLDIFAKKDLLMEIS